MQIAEREREAGAWKICLMPSWDPSKQMAGDVQYPQVCESLSKEKFLGMFAET